MLMLQIVAGMEPENTNYFLQMLGRAARLTDAANIVEVNMLGCGQAICTCVLKHAAAIKQHTIDLGDCCNTL
jgi:hypothetical protein